MVKTGIGDPGDKDMKPITAITFRCAATHFPDAYNLQHHQRPVPFIPCMYGMVGQRFIEWLNMYAHAFSFSSPTSYHSHGVTEILLYWPKTTTHKEAYGGQHYKGTRST